MIALVVLFAYLDNINMTNSIREVIYFYYSYQSKSNNMHSFRGEISLVLILLEKP